MTFGKPRGGKFPCGSIGLAGIPLPLLTFTIPFTFFSSIPTERRNVEFKLDATHCYKGWKISRPYACTFGFAHVLDLSALDVGLFLYMARRRGQKRGSMEEDDN